MATATTTNVKKSYEALIGRSKKAALLGSTASVLHWDAETYMPPGGSEHRAEQVALVAGMVHEMSTAPEVGELLSRCEDSELTKDPLAVEAVNIRELRRFYDKATKVPQRLVEELARVSSLSHPAWVEARKESEFKKFLPYLEQIVALNREKAQAYGYKDSPYDALLDDYEPGMTTAEVTTLFSALAKELSPLIQRVVGAKKQPDASILTRSFPVGRQAELGHQVAEAIGFDFRCGRIDTVTHPFCSGFGPGDTRITTRYDEHFFNPAFFGIMHEAGHGIYDQGVAKEHFGTPMGMAISLGIHESQSRTWENFVGRGRPFWTFFYPQARAAFPEALRDVPFESFLHAVNAVKPSYIRVEADEATYNQHIILRFEIEQKIISGELKPVDIPEAWNARFKELLGIPVPDDRRGCLQDVHWSLGDFGYFATYAIGNLYAAQFCRQAQKDIPGLETQFAKGEFQPFLDWLRKGIHMQGMRFRAKELVHVITAQPLGHQALMAHLKDKYSALYNL